MSDDSARQRYREAKAIALEALEYEPARRRAIIESRCASDEALEREVEWLIEAAEDDADDEVPERFQAAARGALQDVSLEVPLPRNYRLIKRLGQGGMGIVYLAERVDGNLRQPVAFKLLHLHESDNEVLSRRFSIERGILSALDHPCIARLIDGGLTADGRPFLATEFVEGVPIDQWAASGRSRAEILAMFIKVCQAVDYAHRHMVIHRDLKPANILVTPSGEPKLLDFGVARLLDSDSEAGEGAGALTLAYASPEQVQGAGLSVATDVYSLGVLLYELLGGKSPFEGTHDPATLRERVLRGRYSEPRARDGTPLPRDLASVIDRAMHVEERKRYDSVRSLADDLQRFRTYRPVRAYGGGVLYRSGRFMRRHRLTLALGLVAVAALAAFLVDRERQLDRVAWERDRAEAVTEFVSELLAGADSLPSRGNDVTVREILDRGRQQLAETERGNPDALGQMYRALGEAYNALGLGEQAVPLLQKAQEMRQGKLQPDERAMLQSELGAAYDSAGRAIEAIDADEQAIALLEQSQELQDTRELIHVRIRRLRNQVNVLAEAPQAVIADLEAIIDELDDASASSELLFEARSALVGARVAAGQEEAALADAVKARQLAETVYDEGDPRRLRGRYVHATALMLSDPQQAVTMFESLLSDHERLVGPSQRMANTVGNLGVALSRLGRNQESIAAFERAAGMIEASVGRDHYLYRLSITNLAALHLRDGEAAEAERLVRDILPGLERRQELFGGVETLYLASALEVLGGAQVMQGKHSKAAETYGRALDSLKPGSGEQWANLRERITAKLAELEREFSRN
ncbi:MULTISPECIES: serine/threonine-protein kinase [unclassified Wenzhouxiangella]|uniref:serine/threonine-protein kinase n=1 Tax=unclassified Wenzhouxiangella TaxID=2613841 RepID=UPI000E32A6E8|nr:MULTISPECIES: serine/threonine-protein kinase [unclassified Wenzhouxiangella]RFF27543.1 serine/threonine protein kinase [Wenzhouxiangella sp. 15181]RFP69595.1 serine/threonine protein kinase [Wenzhouxiangella sp. 15190]